MCVCVCRYVCLVGMCAFVCAMGRCAVCWVGIDMKKCVDT